MGQDGNCDDLLVVSVVSPTSEDSYVVRVAKGQQQQLCCFGYGRGAEGDDRD